MLVYIPSKQFDDHKSQNYLEKSDHDQLVSISSREK